MQFKAGALELVRKNGFKLFGLKRRFREDPEVRVAAVQQNWRVFEQLKDEFGDDAAVVRVAVAQDRYALYDASYRLKNDQAFVDSIQSAEATPAAAACAPLCCPQLA